MNNTETSTWITDHLPESPAVVWITYLTATNERKVYKAWCSNGNWFTPGYKQIYNPILAWMPITTPEAYLGDEHVADGDPEMIEHYINER